MRKFLVLAAVLAGAAQSAAAQQTEPPEQPHWPPATFLTQEVDLTRSLSSLSMRLSLRILTADLMKKHIHEWRPDGSTDNSMPSRHAIWAYGVAGSLAYSTGPYTPWITVITHTLANGVGMQRVMARRHWPGDVYAGAAIGVGLDLIVRGAVNLAFGSEHLYHGWRQVDNDHTTAFMSGTGAWLPTRDRIGCYEIGTAFSSWLRCHYGHGPLGISADISVMSAPLKDMNIPVETDHPTANVLHPLNSITASIGPVLHLAIADGPVAVRAEARCGYRAWLGNSSVDISSGSLTGATAAGIDVALTPRLQIGAEGGYDISRIRIAGTPRTLGAFTVAILTRACF